MSTKFSPSILIVSSIVFVVCLAGGFIYSLSQPSIYEASARIWIQPRVPPQLAGQSTQSTYTPLTHYYKSPISTAAEVLRSKLVIIQAYTRLKKVLPPAHCPTIYEIRSELETSAAKDADLLTIRFRSRYREAVAPVVQAVLDEFIKVNNSQSASSAAQSRIWLEAELQTVKAKYKEAAAKLRNFQNVHQTVDMSAQVKTMLDNRSDLESQLAKTKCAISEQQSKIAFLQSQLGLGPEDAMTVQKLAQDEILKGLRARIAEDQIHLVEARSTFKEVHPRIQQLEQFLKRSKTALEERIHTLLSRSGEHLAQTEIASYDPVRQQLLSDMVRARSEEIALETGLRSISQLLAAANNKLKEVPDQQGQNSLLVRAEQAAAEELAEVEHRLQTAKVQEQVAYNSSNVQIIDSPETPSQPVYPKKESDLIIAGLLGLAGGTGTFLGMFFLDPCLRRSQDATEILSLPVVGWIDQLASNARNALSVHNTMAMRRLHVGLTGLLKSGQNIVIITSPNSGDGKTTVAAGLAMSLAQSSTRVLLIDANLLISNHLHQIFNVAGTPGLSHYLESPDSTVASKILRPVKKNLMFIPCGTTAETEPSLLTTGSLEKLINDVQSPADIVLIDTPSCNVSAVSLALLDKAVHLLVVIRLGHSSKQALRELASQLEFRHFTAASIVFADAKEDDMPEAPEAGEPKVAGQMSTAW